MARQPLEPDPSGTSRSVPDADLMTRIAFGDEAAFDELVERYWRILVQYASAFVSGGDAAEDIVQETFIRVWERRQKWVSRGSPRGFLYTIVRNLCFQERDRIAVRRRWAEQEGAVPGVSPSAEDLLRDREIHDAFHGAVHTLPTKRREVFTLVFIHGLSYAEAADVLGLSISTVGNQVSAALRTVRDALRSYTHESK